MSIRQQIIDAVVARMKTILTTNGYITNVGEHVWEWKTTPYGPKDRPGLSVREPVTNVTAQCDAYVDWAMELEIEIVAEDAALTAAQLRSMKEDIYKAIGTDEYWGNLAARTHPVSDEAELVQEDTVLGAGLVKIKILYKTPRWGM
jgi:hypothetical protein